MGKQKKSCQRLTKKKKTAQKLFFQLPPPPHPTPTRANEPSLSVVNGDRVHNAVNSIPCAVIPTANPSAKTSSGLLEWGSVEKSLEALAACNHYVVRNPGENSPVLISHHKPLS